MNDEGSYAVGFVLGFFLTWIGLILAVVLNKPRTRRGAVHGFLGSLLLYGAMIGFGIAVATGYIQFAF